MSKEIIPKRNEEGQEVKEAVVEKNIIFLTEKLHKESARMQESMGGAVTHYKGVGYMHLAMNGAIDRITGQILFFSVKPKDHESDKHFSHVILYFASLPLDAMARYDSKSGIFDVPVDILQETIYDDKYEYEVTDFAKQVMEATRRKWNQLKEQEASKK